MMTVINKNQARIGNIIVDSSMVDLVILASFRALATKDGLAR